MAGLEKWRGELSTIVPWSSTMAATITESRTVIHRGYAAG